MLNIRPLRSVRESFPGLKFPSECCQQSKNYQFVNRQETKISGMSINIWEVGWYQLEHSLLMHLAEETGMSNETMRTTKLLNYGLTKPELCTFFRQMFSNFCNW
jgi:hypothetical protein